MSSNASQALMSPLAQPRTSIGLLICLFTAMADVGVLMLPTADIQTAFEKSDLAAG